MKVKKITITKIAGIDYSLTSPCICVCDIQNEKFDFNNCEFHFFAQTKHQLQLPHKNLFSYSPIKYTTESERYNKLSEWVLDIFSTNFIKTNVYFEDYAFAATGRVFHIAENVGVLKHKFWQQNIKYETFAPTTIKKTATGKGSSSKRDMYESFVEQTEFDFRKDLAPNSTEIGNPVSDIVDSYFICKHGYEQKEKIKS